MAQIPGAPSITDLAEGGQYFQAPILNQRQQEIQNRTGELGLQRLENPQQGFDPIATNARNEFYSDVVPGLAERFTAMGGGQRGSGFQRALGRAGSNLQSNLAAQGAQYGLQQQGLANQQLNTGLQPQYSQAYYQPQDNQLGGQLGSAGTNFLASLAKDPDVQSYIKEKLGFGGTANKATNDVAKAAVEGVTSGVTSAATTAATKGAKPTADLITAAAPAVAGTTLGTAATKLAPTNPALAKVAANAAAAKAAGGAAAGTAAGGTAAATVAKVGLEAAIAPALAKFGAVAMPLVAIPLMLWIGSEIVKGLYEEFKEEPLF
jgi:hypothetical protein